MNKVFFLVAIVSVAAADSGNYPSGNDPYKVNKNNPSYNMQNTYSNSRYTEQYESYAPQPYEFGYEVNDGYQSDFGHQETGDGKGSVSGSYHVKLPDGRNQRVTYKDDGYGFVADVQYEGLAQYPVNNEQTGYSNQNNGDNDPYSNPIYRSEPSSHNSQLHHKATHPYSSSVQY